jgi:zinc protease
MIKYSRKVLDNGLTLLHHHDATTPFVVVNVLYKVGARDEEETRTGFAHLFEHLMFEGSRHAASYDEPLQKAGGENNAFTNNDYTNYYSMVPANNAEVSFWLESDRMQFLNINTRSLNVQRKVVIEEFKEHYINQPYGNVWHLLREMVYTSHPYRWPTIGLTTDHIAGASLEDVKAFYRKHYQPSNAILAVSGNISWENVQQHTDKWFSDIASMPVQRPVRTEPSQSVQRRLTVHEPVPLNAIYMAFRNCDRKHPLYPASDLMSDILSTGQSSRLYDRLVKEQQLFIQIDAYIDGAEESGLFVIEGKLAEGIAPETAEAAVWDEIRQLQEQSIPEYELRKVKNKAIAYIHFSDNDLLGRTISLAYYEMLGDASEVNREEEKVEAITSSDVQSFSREYLRPENSNIMYYLRKS